MSRRASSRNTKKNEPEPEPVAVSASKRRRGAETTTAASTQGDEEDTQPKKRSTSNASVAKEQPASTSTNVKAVKSRKPSADVGETADTKTKKGKSDKPPSTAGAPPISIAKDSKIRCVWATKHPLELEYHDSEWGAWPMPAKGYSDKKYFEFLILESAQAGLSWLTILKKREAYKTAFADFDFDAVAKFTAKDVERLLKSDGGSPELTIVRNKAKIEATIEAAKLFRSSILKDHGSAHAFFASFFKDGQPVIYKTSSKVTIRPTSPESDAISAALKERGFKFVGSTIVHALLQALGWVNEHSYDCFRHPRHLK